MRPLYLTAHYDDMEVCAGGTASRYGGKTVVLYPRVAHGKRADAEAAAKILLLTIGTPPEVWDDRNTVEWLDEFSQDCDTIISTSPWDSHPEHREVADIARQLTRRNDKTLMFMDHAIPGGLAQSPRPNTFVTYEYPDVKREALSQYGDMVELYGPGWIEAAMHRDAYYGWMVGSEYAEGFIKEMGAL